MISVSSHKFSTPNRTGTVDFPLFNEGQLVRHEFTLNFNYNFNSTVQAQFIVSALNQITLLSGTFADKGIVVGDSLDIDAVVTAGADIDINGAIVASINGNILTFTTNVFATVSLNQLFPQGNNGQMFVVNNTRNKPASIDLFYNLLPFSSPPTNNSIWDGTQNRLTVGVPSADSTVNFTQLGNKSGGTFFNAQLEKDGSDYIVTLEFIPWLGIENNDFSMPPWYAGINTLKTFINIVGFNVVGNPNSTIQTQVNNLFGNTGWYNEAYNEGIDNFVISDFLIEDGFSNPITSLAVNTSNKVSFKVSHLTEDVIEDVQVSVYSFFPFEQSKNNQFSRLQNQLGSLFPSNESLKFGEKAGAWCKIEDLNITNDSGAKLVDFEVNVNTEFKNLVENQTEPVLYRLAINVQADGDSPMDNVTKTLSESAWQTIAPPPTPIGGRDPGFLYFYQNIGEETTENYSGCTEDDFLFTTKFDLPKNAIFQNFRLAIECRRNSDNALVATLQETLLDFVGIPIVSGKYQFNQSIGFPQFLDSPNRNAITLNLTGEEDSTTYGVEFIASLMANWRDWLPLINALPDFYDFTLPLNGQTREWVNYLRLLGYQIRLRLEFNSPTGQLFLNKQISLLDYNEFTDSACLIELIDSLGNAQPVQNGEIIALSNAMYTIRATHTVTGMVIEDYDVIHGYIGLRPNNGEPMKRISTSHDWTTLNSPLQPLPNETRAVGTVINPSTYRVEARVNSNDLSNLTTIVSGFKNPKYSNFWVFADWSALGVTNQATFIAWVEANSDYTVDSVTDFSLVGTELKCNISASGGTFLNFSLQGFTEIKAIGNGFYGLITISLTGNNLTTFTPILSLPTSVIEIRLGTNNISNWDLLLPWITAQPAFTNPCQIITSGNPTSAVGTAFETELNNKNGIIVE